MCGPGGWFNASQHDGAGADTVRAIGLWKMRIVIFGTGGAGGYFGPQLALAGEDVVFIARGEHLSAIRSKGLRLESHQGEQVIHPAQATIDAAQVGGVDVVLVGVKAWQVTEAAHAIRPMIKPETIVVPLQN